MTWYLLCTCLPAPGEESLRTPCLDIYQSEQSKSTLMQGRYCSQDRLTNLYLYSLFGMMSRHLQREMQIRNALSKDAESSGTSSASVDVSRVKTSLAPGKWLESTAKNPDYGKNLPESFAIYDRDMRFWKIPQCLFATELMLSSMTFPKWGMLLRGELFPQKTLGRRISEKDFGGLPKEKFPTPKAHDGKQCVTRQYYDMRCLKQFIFSVFEFLVH